MWGFRDRWLASTRSNTSRHSGIMCAVGFSPRKANMTLYLAPSIFKEPSRLKKLGPHRTSVACLYITNLENIEVEVCTR